MHKGMQGKLYLLMCCSKSIQVNVKWGKQKYTVDVNTAEPPLVFKSQLFALTGVLPERQKSMYNFAIFYALN